MPDPGGHDVTQVVQAEAEEVVEALALELSDEALAKRVRNGRPRRDANAPHALRLPESAEPAGVLAVPVVDEVARRDAYLVELPAAMRKSPPAVIEKSPPWP